MNYSQAKATAKAKVFETRIDHVISFDGVNHSVHMAKGYKGRVIETVKYKKPKTDAISIKKGKGKSL